MKTLFAFVFTLMLCLQAEARKYDDIIDSGFITIAVYSEFPPYSYRENGIPKGIDVEIGKLIAESMGLRPHWFWVVADETLDDDLRNSIWKGHYLGGGVADFMMRVPYDKEFEHKTDGYGQLQNEFIVLTGPYQQESWALARNTKKLAKLPNLAPLQYEKIGVELDSAPDFFLSTVFGGRLINSIKHYSNISLATDALLDKRISAVAGMKGQLEWNIGENSEKASQGNFVVSDEGIGQWPRRKWDIGLAIKHTYRQLGYALEEEIDKLVKGGKMEAIFKRYHMQYTIPMAYQPES